MIQVPGFGIETEFYRKQHCAVVRARTLSDTASVVIKLIDSDCAVQHATDGFVTSIPGEIEGTIVYNRRHTARPVWMSQPLKEKCYVRQSEKC